jgi:MFS family permease
VAFLPLPAIGNLGMTPAGIGIVLSAYLLTGGGVQGIVGPIVDRTNKIALISIFSTAGPLLLLLIPQALSMKGLLAILLPIAVMGSFARGSLMAINVETGKDYHGMGTIFGFSAGAHSMGRMIGPVLLGTVMDLFETSAVFTWGAVLGCCGGIVSAWLLIKHSFRKRKNKSGAI